MMVFNKITLGMGSSALLGIKDPPPCPLRVPLFDQDSCYVAKVVVMGPRYLVNPLKKAPLGSSKICPNSYLAVLGDGAFIGPPSTAKADRRKL